MNKFDEEKQYAQRMWKLRQREKRYKRLEQFPEMQSLTEHLWDLEDMRNEDYETC